MKINEYFSRQFLRNALQKAEITLPIEQRYKNAYLEIFNQGVSDGIENGDGFPCASIDCTLSKFYRVGKQVGEICRETFKVGESHPAVVESSMRSDIGKVSKTLSSLVDN